MAKRELQVNDQEETILSTEARAARLTAAVHEARAHLDARSRRRRILWIALGAIAALILVVVAASR